MSSERTGLKATRPKTPQPSSLAWATRGAAARKLEPSPQQGEAAGRGRQRTSLSVVPSRSRRRFPFVLLCLTLLACAMVGVLMLNVLISSNQYVLVRLTSQKTEVEKANAELTQRRELLRSPQALAAKARELGMVRSHTTAQIDARNGTITGDPKPAEKKGEAAPLVPAPQIMGVQIPGQANPVPQDSQGGPNGATIPAPKQRIPRP